MKVFKSPPAFALLSPQTHCLTKPVPGFYKHKKKEETASRSLPLYSACSRTLTPQACCQSSLQINPCLLNSILIIEDQRDERNLSLGQDVTDHKPDTANKFSDRKRETFTENILPNIYKTLT